MSHALLLRLLVSPSFFSLHVALQYLRIYHANVGITWYIVRRLRSLAFKNGKNLAELRDVWGFICHLLVTHPSKSTALESFVLEMVGQEAHFASLTLWFMQAMLRDLDSGSKNESPHKDSFLICQRVLHRCHEVIFMEVPANSNPYLAPLSTSASKRPLKSHFEPALVGIGVALIGFAQPTVSIDVGEVVLEQGRAGTEALQSLDPTTGEDDDDEDITDVPQAPALTILSPKPQKSIRTRPVMEASQTLPALPVYFRGIRRSRNSLDPLGQLDRDESGEGAYENPSQSSPALPTSIHSALPVPMLGHSHSHSVPNTAPLSPYPRSAPMSFPQLVLQSLPPSIQTQLLRAHFLRSQLSFIAHLESISNRLLVVPKPARNGALRAELVQLNARLGQGDEVWGICAPGWCNGCDSAVPTSSSSPTNSPIPSAKTILGFDMEPSTPVAPLHRPHHRILRIPPGDCVVLNSAQRAPFLLLLEVLEDEQDFDPTTRANRDTLKKVVSGDTKTGPTAVTIDVLTSASEDRSSSHGPVTSIPTLPPTPLPPDTLDFQPPDDEEIDLIEQLYGTSHTPFTLDEIEDNIVLPARKGNRELDRVAWERGDPGTPASLPTGNSFANGSPIASAGLSLDQYSDRMRTAAIMLAQLNANLAASHSTSGPNGNTAPAEQQGALSWIPGSSWLTSTPNVEPGSLGGLAGRNRLQQAEATAIRERIMEEMIALEDERVGRMRSPTYAASSYSSSSSGGSSWGAANNEQDEGIIRRELTKADPSAVVFSESWAAKKARIRHNSPYGHLASWSLVSLIHKTGSDLRQEQLATQLIREFGKIWEEESVGCWVKGFRILITSSSTGLVETVKDAVSIHSIKKSLYARRLASQSNGRGGGSLGVVTLMDHFTSTYGAPTSAKFARAQRNFAKSLAGYSLLTHLLQIKDRHNGNILLDREGHVIHIDFGFMLANAPGNINAANFNFNLDFEAAPFKITSEYLQVLGGIEGEGWKEFRHLCKEGFAAARKHCERVVTLVELMQKDSTMPCFAAFGSQTAAMLRERFVPSMTHSLVGDHVDRLIDNSLGSNWTRLYDSFQYYSQSIL